jgi:hypothetical protein
MTNSTISLTTDERAWLRGLLENALKETQIEEHRTRTLSYRQHIIHNEELIQSILNKLNK